MKKYKILQWIPWILFPFFILAIVLLRDGKLLEMGIDFSIIHNLCSISMLSHTVELVDYQALAIRIGIISLLLTVILGPFFCSYICPFGTLQKWLFYIGEHFKISKKMPKKLNAILMYLKYGILGIFIFLTINQGVIYYINIDPYHGFIRLFYGGLPLIGGLYLVLVVIASLFYRRAFCSYLCPYGAAFKVLAMFRVFGIKRNEDTCINCKKCDKICPSQIVVSEKIQVNDLECYSCNECIVECPKEKTLTKDSNILSFISFVVAVVLASLFLLGIVRFPEEVIYAFTAEEVIEIDEAYIPAIEESVEEIETKPPVYIQTALQKQIEMERLAAEKRAIRNELYLKELQALEDARLEAERLEAERLEAERVEAARLEAERLEAERLEAERLEAERIAAANQNKYNDGTYRSTVNGYRPNMVIQVKIKDDTILSVEVIEHRESKSYFKFSASKMIDRILKANSYDVNVVSGATFTSKGIKSGVKACLNQAKK